MDVGTLDHHSEHTREDVTLMDPVEQGAWHDTSMVAPTLPNQCRTKHVLHMCFVIWVLILCGNPFLDIMVGVYAHPSFGRKFSMKIRSHMDLCDALKTGIGFPLQDTKLGTSKVSAEKAAAPDCARDSP